MYKNMHNEFVYILEEFSPKLRGSGFSCGFAIFIDKDFALRLKNTKLDQEQQLRFQELARRQVLNPLGRGPASEPYSFFEDTLLVSSFHADKGGLWLSTDLYQINDLENPLKRYIEYNSHNSDNPSQAYSLVSLFTRWVHYSQSFLR